MACIHSVATNIPLYFTADCLVYPGRTLAVK